MSKWTKEGRQQVAHWWCAVLRGGAWLGVHCVEVAAVRQDSATFSNINEMLLIVHLTLVKCDLIVLFGLSRMGPWAEGRRAGHVLVLVLGSWAETEVKRIISWSRSFLLNRKQCDSPIGNDKPSESPMFPALPSSPTSSLSLSTYLPRFTWPP